MTSARSAWRSVTPDGHTSESAINSLLAIDFGARRIGLAIGTPVSGTSSPLTTLQALDGEPDWAELDALLAEWQPDLLVFGLPYNSDGTPSDMTARVREFAALLEERYSLPVDFVDERFTSVEARAELNDQRRQGIRRKRIKKEDIDAAAARLIAESWMAAADKRTTHG